MNETTKMLFQKYGLQAIVQILSIVIGVFIAYFGITQNIALLNKRVEAVEKVSDLRTPLVERFIQTENTVANIKSDIKDIKESQIRMENKIDSLRK